MDPEIMQIVRSNIWKVQIAVLTISIVAVVISIMAWHGKFMLPNVKNREKTQMIERILSVAIAIVAIYYPINITLDNIKFDVQKTVQTVVKKESAGMFNYMYSIAILENHERLDAWKLIGNISIGEKYEIYYGENSKVIFYFKEVE